jgi:S-adenosylmethionine-diacylgycerolhomoserine-N-methlytransferase
MRRLDRLRGDLIVLRQMLRGMPREGDPGKRLQDFYRPQAERYDEFRDRLLPGRAEMIAQLSLPARAQIVELGGGTGRNIEFFGARIGQITDYQIVDLCPALLERAEQRASRYRSIRAIQADATIYDPPEPVDCVILSYALTMMPAWRAAIGNALRMLKPGGVLGVVDFYIGAPEPRSGAVCHGAFSRWFWPRWFVHDGVRLNADHLPSLREMLPGSLVYEGRASVPYLPGPRVPYYWFVGRKPKVRAASGESN